ncbi:MAG TPA: FAD-linked oxidase C-terminal domain-containing protein, partial [Gemmatimonadaceae bacterium]|nr:FAD-linked oxidase C-terminal domain-containing protein [Gemmatimonadaceae bacterium]
WRGRVGALLDEVTALVGDLRGTLAGEHGDGRLRTPLLDKVWSAAAMRLFADIKIAMDPRGILNPGVKVPMPGQQPLGDIKYDPALPPLPAPARAALDRIEVERAWSTFRLSLGDGGG